MTYFKLDIPKINDCISKYKKTKKEYIDDLSVVYNNLNTTQLIWNDVTASSFVERVKKDRSQEFDYFEYMDKMYNEISTFKNNIDSICHAYGYSYNSIVLKFSDSEISYCKQYLNSAIEYLNIAYNDLYTYGLSELSCYSSICNIRYEVDSIRDTIIEIKNNIENLVNSINNELLNSNIRAKKIINNGFALKPMEYNLKILSVDENNL